MPKLHEAQVDWRDGTVPESRQFGDIYFSPRDGLAETRHVFLDGIGAPEIWIGKGHFVIGETGFGTGLNFLATWAAWRKTAQAGDRLHYLSVEGFPLEKDALCKALSVWTEISELSENLIDEYPALQPGFHRLTFDDGRVSLTLLFGEAADMLSQVEGRVDAWYLDGFAPSKNPEMWRPAVLQQLARLSGKDAKLATFTAAGQVRRDLADQGFVMSKAPGFGHKRECLRGIFAGAQADYAGSPWFAPSRDPVWGPVAVIGGGVAGLALARKLTRSGLQVTVYEATRIGAVGSGNRVGLIQPRLTASDSLDGRFNATAYLHACRFYDQLGETGAGWTGPRGVLQLARDEGEATRFARLVEEGRLPAAEMQFIDGARTSDLAGVPLHSAGLYFPSGGGVSPQGVLAACARDIDIVEGAIIARLEPSQDGWALLSPDGTVIGEASTVVLANGPFARTLWDIGDLPLTANRGQVAHVAATDASQRLKLGLSYGNYLSPAVTADDGAYHVSGASFGRWEQPLDDETWRDLSAAEEAAIIDELKALSSAFDAVAPRDGDPGRAALRATTPDHLPVAGQVHDASAFDREYESLHHGRRESLYPAASYIPGLYAMTGLGARGFQTAPLLAEMLADLMLGTPLPVSRDVLEALHCGRYQIRRLRRKRGR